MPMKLFANDSGALLISRIVLAFSWIYQGAVPKLICMNPGEIELLQHVVVSGELACTLVMWMGYGEIAFGAFLFFTRNAWFFILNIAALLMLLFYVAIFQTDLLVLPFNPVILNLSLCGLSLIAIIELRKQRDAREN